MSYFSLVQKKRMAADEGFSILELIVVLVVLSLIIGLAAPAIISQFGTAKSKTAGIEVNRLKTNVEMFRVDVGRFPTNDEGLQALLTAGDGVAGWNGPYVDRASSIIDPWGNEYVYTVSDDGDTIEVSSLGRDGAEGGDGEDADVSSLD